MVSPPAAATAGTDGSEPPGPAVPGTTERRHPTRWLATARGVVLPVVLIVMIGLAGAVLGRVYADPLLTRLVLGAGVGSVLVSVAVRRLPSWLVAPVSVTLLLGWTAFSLHLAARHAAVPGGFAEVALDAATNGIPRLLTAMIPVEPAPDTVLVPVVAAWLAGLAAAEVALRAGRVLLGYLPPALLYAGAVYVVGPNADPALWPTVALAATAALGLTVPAGRGARVGGAAVLSPAVRRAVRVRLAAGTAAGLAVVIALVAAVGPALVRQLDERPVDPRRYVEPPQVETLDENPLIRISGWALNPEQKLLEVRPEGGSGDPGAENPDGPAAEPGAGEETDPPADGTEDGTEPTGTARIRLAVLSDYDGVTWRVGATYRNAGRVLPPTRPAPDTRVETVRQEITIAGLSGRLLPAVATPQQVEGARVAYDPSTGTLIRPDGLNPGLRYTVTSQRERPDVNLLASADVPAGAAVARVLQVPDGAPEQFGRLAAQLAEENGAPYSRAAAIEQFLAEHYRMVADAPSGHAYPNLGFFLFGPRTAGGQRGTSEQFAAAFAVLGRMVGLPTRVVVGFSTPAGGGEVRAADAIAWPEVLFDGLGWVAFDPLPRPDAEPRPVEEDLRPEPVEPPPSEAPVPTLAPTATTPPAVGAAPGGSRGIGLPVLVGAGFGALLLLGGLLLVGVAGLRRAQRRRRLTEGTPADRIAGAWREVTDALRLAGRPVASHLAATEVATGADLAADPGGPPPPPVTELAELVNLAAFAPQDASEAQAARAATIADDYVSALRAARPRWRRLIWSAHPGPLRWRR